MSNPQLQPIDIHSMSEDELSKIDPSKFESSLDGQPTEPVEPEPEVEENQDNQDPEPEDNEGQDPEVDEGDEGTDPEVQPEGNGDAPAQEPAKAPTNPQNDKAEPDPKTEPADTDYQALYTQIVGTPIKANGKEIVIKSAEEAIQMIQMGANYHQKMAAMKPIRKVAGMLEQSGIRDEADVGFLIDLHNKNPEAIARLVKDSGIDIYELNLDGAENYKTQAQGIDDATLDLKDTIEDLRANHEDFQPFFDGLLQSWDPASQEVLAKNPHAIRMLHQAHSAGNYQKIMAAIDSAITLGQIPASVNRIQAYTHFENQLLEAGQLNQPQAKAPVAPVQTAPISALKKQPAQDPSKKRAASPRNAPKTKPVIPENIHLLSDAEFAKIDPSKFN